MFDSGNSNVILEGRENLTAMQALWCAVVKECWEDAFFETKGAGAATRGAISESRRKARSWFGSRDFRQVCAMAGVDDEAILDEFKRKVKAAKWNV